MGDAKVDSRVMVSGGADNNNKDVTLAGKNTNSSATANVVASDQDQSQDATVLFYEDDFWTCDECCHQSNVGFCY